MPTISTVSFKRTLVRFGVYFIIFMAILSTTAIAFAKDKPAQDVMDYLNTFPIVHDGTCNVDSLKLYGKECYILFDDKNNVVWVLLYDDEMLLTHILASKDSNESLLWCRSDVCT